MLLNCVINICGCCKLIMKILVCEVILMKKLPKNLGKALFLFQ